MIKNSELKVTVNRNDDMDMKRDGLIELILERFRYLDKSQKS